MSATPNPTQVVDPVTSVNITVAASPPAGFTGTGWIAPPNFPNVVLGASCTSAATTCTVTYTRPSPPTFDIPQTFTVQYSGFDVTGAPSTGSANITVTDYPSAPTANSFSVQTPYATPVSVNLATAGDITYDSAVSAGGVNVIVTQPKNGTATVSGTTISYTPNAGFSGSDSVPYTVSDGGLTSAFATMTVTVAPQVQITPPKLQATLSPAQLVDPAQTVTATVAAQLPAGASLSLVSGGWSITQSPSQGTAVLQNCSSSATCSVLYTAPAQHVLGPPGVQFSVQVAGTECISDTCSSVTGSVTVTVIDYASAPTAKNFSVQTPQGKAVSVNLATAGDISYDGAVSASGVQVSVAQAPAHGSATVSGTTITYTPNANYFGTDTVGYGVSAGGLSSASATMTVMVGQGQSTIPKDVVGKTQAAGTSELTQDGFIVSVIPQVSSVYASGIVIGTQPAVGSVVPRGTAIKMIVSRGPGPAASAPLSSLPGLTGEQAAVARGLEQTCSALAAAYTAGTALTSQQQELLNTCTAIISTYRGGGNIPGLQQTLNAISGRQATAMARLPMQFAAGQIANVGSRLAALRSGERGLSTAGLDLGLPGGAESALGPFSDMLRGVLGGAAGDENGSLLGNRLGIFVTGTFRRGTEDTTDAEQGFDFKDSGATLGIDYRFGNSLILGLAGGYAKSEADFDDASGRLDAKQWSISLYGTWFRDAFHIDWLLGYGHNDYDITRNINFNVDFPAGTSLPMGCSTSSCAIQTTGSTGAREYTGSLATGFDFHSQALAYGPLLEFEYKQVGVDGFTESDQSGLDLRLGSITTSSLVSKLGGYASYAVKTQWFVMLPQVQVRYLHEFLNDARTQQVNFAADTLPGAQDRAYLVFTNPPGRNYYDWRASLVFQFAHGIAGFVDYGQLGGLTGISNRQFDIGLRVEHQ